MSKVKIRYCGKEIFGTKNKKIKDIGAPINRVVQTAVTDFGPWGLRLNGTGVVNSFENRWGQQGKEKEMTFGLNRINFGAWVYNPTIRRFDRADPLGEIFPTLSPYSYAINNPVLFNDRFGLFPMLWFNGMPYMSGWG